MKLKDLKPGDVLYDCHSHKMGNTTIKSYGVWSVKIIEVFDSHALVSWNGNTPERYYENRVKSLLREKPVLVSCGFMGKMRKETKEERKSRLALESVK